MDRLNTTLDQLLCLLEANTRTDIGGPSAGELERRKQLAQHEAWKAETTARRNQAIERAKPILAQKGPRWAAETREEIVDAFADSVFLHAWAEANPNAAGPGEDFAKKVPPTPEAIKREAAHRIKSIETQAHAPLPLLYLAALELPGKHYGGTTAEDFGRALGRSAAGAGGWDEDHPRMDLRVAEWTPEVEGPGAEPDDEDGPDARYRASDAEDDDDDDDDDDRASWGQG